MFKLVVLSCVLASAAASALGWAGLGVPGLIGAPGIIGAPGLLGVPGAWGVPGVGAWGVPGAWGGHLAAPAVGVAGAPAIHAYNYRGPLSLAPGQPANILAADGRPLDTISVNLDRAAHLTARAVDSSRVHLLKKRSAPLLAPAVAWSHSARVDVPARIVGPAPLWGGVAPWGVGPLGVGHLGPLARVGPVGPWGLGLGHGLW